ncbi:MULTISPECIES: iron-sulfur cluster assembly accessory protein [unclassified Acidisoma]|jgi:iron-sulfur cluster insertion protein|uniref:HesB/IscA family protein n=1 Tax=unclassified Acidisoma TaxID=2634065 RepID=UPI00131C23F7|nr:MULTISPECIES: iron-sulfur cluster assembly accessory protein [unclassified Acidisoma]
MTEQNASLGVPGSFGVTDRAAAQIAQILSAQSSAALRVAVLAGGCSGFQYSFDLDEAPPTDEDMVIERDGARVLVDQSSLTLLGGAQLDYTDALMGAHFAIKNPNATSACGCGSSFSID